MIFFLMYSMLVAPVIGCRFLFVRQTSTSPGRTRPAQSTKQAELCASQAPTAPLRAPRRSGPRFWQKPLSTDNFPKVASGAHNAQCAPDATFGKCCFWAVLRGPGASARFGGGQGTCSGALWPPSAGGGGRRRGASCQGGARRAKQSFITADGRRSARCEVFDHHLARCGIPALLPRRYGLAPRPPTSQSLIIFSCCN